MSFQLMESNYQVFFEFVRAGLFPERELKGSKVHVFKDVNWDEVDRLAEEQSVVGLVAAGIEKVQEVQGFKSLSIPKEWSLQFVGRTLQIEQRNKDLNVFLAGLIDKLRMADVYAILVKGQGIAQCYEKPLWRACGDVDLLLNSTNYEKAKKVLLPLAEDVECEFKTLKHLGMNMKGGYVVELHGLLHSRLSKRVDKVIDEAQNDVFYGGNVQSENFKDSRGLDVLVFLPSADNDVIFVFTHILKHFYIEGIGLRQICDWCRLLWTYRETLNLGLLESRIRKAGLMSEWKAFGAFAVEYLGMPAEAMPFYSSKVQDVQKFKKKAQRIMEFVLEAGNFGHNREIKRSSIWIVGEIQAAWFKMKDFAHHARVFPLDSVKFFLHYLVDGIQQARVQRR